MHTYTTAPKSRKQLVLLEQPTLARHDRARGDGCELVSEIILDESTIFDSVVCQSDHDIKQRLQVWHTDKDERRVNAILWDYAVSGRYNRGVRGLDGLMRRWKIGANEYVNVVHLPACHG